MAGFTEDELVGTIRRLLSGEFPGVRLGPGDDAALVEAGRGLGVLTVDMLVEGVHFDRETWTAHDVGAKAVTVNVSDVAAMGASPRFGVVALGLPTEIGSAWVVELFGGMRQAADEYAMALVGGDVSRAGEVTVSVAVSGEVAEGRAVTRSGARAGDRIVVTGELGAAAAGLLLATGDPGVSRQAVAEGWGRELLTAHFRPLARVGEGQTLAQCGATAMMDLSDGLALDLSRLCRESGVGAAVSLSDVPVAPGVSNLATRTDLDTLRLALSGGEDFELLATVPATAVGTATDLLAERFGTRLTDLGEIREGGEVVAVEADGRERPLPAEGWDHFDD